MNIKELREKYGLSRQEFCDLLRIPYRTVQSWELGLRSCPEYVFRMIQFMVEMKCRENGSQRSGVPVEKPVETVENSGYNDNC